MWGLLCASYRQSCLRTLQGRWLTHTTKPSCERVRGMMAPSSRNPTTYTTDQRRTLSQIINQDKLNRVFE